MQLHGASAPDLAVIAPPRRERQPTVAGRPKEVSHGPRTETAAELVQLSYFTESLIDELRSVDDTDELRTELGGFCESIEFEMSQKLRM
jgi:hypothetical protein